MDGRRRRRRVRWGILSTADIGLKKVIPGLRRSPRSEVLAIASREDGAGRSRGEGTLDPARAREL